MKKISQRRAFTGLLTLLATLSGVAFGLYDLRWQSDFIVDVIKISGLLAVTSLCVSFVVWTVTHLKEDSVFRGGLAGLLAGLTIVPIPYFASALKTEFFRLYASENRGFVMSMIEAIPLAVQNGLVTFILITKVSLAAVISSLILGVIIAKRVPPRSRP